MRRQLCFPLPQSIIHHITQRKLWQIGIKKNKLNIRIDFILLFAAPIRSDMAKYYGLVRSAEMTQRMPLMEIKRRKMLCYSANAPKTETPDYAIGDMWKGMAIQWHPSQVVTHRLLPVSFTRLEYQKSTQENAKKISECVSRSEDDQHMCQFAQRPD